MPAHALDADVVGSLPVNHPFLRGEFRPTGESVDIDVAVSARTEGFAVVNLAFVWGKAGGALRGEGQYHPLTDRAQRRALGKLAPETAGSVSRRVRVNGLDPGTTYAWALEYAIVGGYEKIVLDPEAVPCAVAFTPDERRAYVADRAGRVWPLTPAGRPGWSYRQDPFPSQLGVPFETGGSARDLAVTPDGTRLVVCEAEAVVVFDTATHELVDSVAVPRRVAEPVRVACPTDTEAWVAFAAGSGGVARLDLGATPPAWDAPIFAGGPVAALALTDDGKALYSLTRADAVVSRHALASGDVISTAGTGLGCDLDLAGDRLWVAADDPGELRAYDAETLVPRGAIALGESSPESVAVTRDSRLVFAANASPARMDYFTTGAVEAEGLPTLAWFDGVDIGRDGRCVQLTSDGYIFMAADNAVQIWPGATFRCEPVAGGAFHDDFAEVTVTGERLVDAL